MAVGDIATTQNQAAIKRIEAFNVTRPTKVASSEVKYQDNVNLTKQNYLFILVKLITRLYMGVTKGLRDAG